MADEKDKERLAEQMAAIKTELRALRERLDSLDKTFRTISDVEKPAAVSEKVEPSEASVAEMPKEQETAPTLRQARQAVASSMIEKAKGYIEPEAAELTAAESKEKEDKRDHILEEGATEAGSEQPGRPSIPAMPARPALGAQQSIQARKKSIDRDMRDEESRERAHPAVGQAIDWREILQRLQVLPPTNEGNVEIQLGTWWATRVGILLAVIGGVFFGIYVSRNTPPWIKFIELSALAAGVTVLGLWLERKLPKFGAVVFGGGLALAYFAIFAGYTLPATKVIDSPITGAILQFLAVTGIVLCAEWRRSHEIATMAVFLGFVSCFFSVQKGLNDFALAASGLLGAAAIWFYLRSAWFAPYQLAVPLTYLVYGIVSIYSWSKLPSLSETSAHRPVPIFPIALSYPLVYMILYGAADYIALVRNRLMPQRTRRLVQICNTTGAIVLGFVMTRAYYADQLHQFYFVFGGVLIAAAIAYYLTRPSDIFSSIYLAKGSALVTLGIITKYRAQTRWMALLVESIVLLLSTKRSRLLITEAAMLIVWLVSAIYFINDAHPLANGAHESLLSPEFSMAFLYAISSAAVLALYGRWFGLNDDLKNNLATFWGRGKGWISPRTILILAFTILILGPYICARMANAYEIANYSTVTFGAITIGLCLVAWLTRSWIPLLAAVFPFFLLHERAWIFRSLPQELLWTNGTIAIALTWALLVALFVLAKKSGRSKPGIIGIGVALHILWVLTLSTLYTKTCSDPVLLFISTATSILLACLSVVLPAFALAEISVLPMIAGISVCMAGIGNPFHEPAAVSLSKVTESALLWIVPLAAFAYSISFAVIADLRNQLSNFGKMAAPWIFPFVAAWATLVSMRMIFDGIGFVMAMQTAALLVVLLCRLPELRPALYIALLFTATAHFFYWGELIQAPKATIGESGIFLWIPIATAILTIAFVPLAHRVVPDMSLPLRKSISWSHGILALFMLYLAFYYRTGSLAHYVTVLWGLSATALLVVGLALRIKPYRIIGMAGLALCIPRIFVVDARSTFYRIIAFFAMGLALLAIGLLYSRYRTVIENWEKENA